MTRYAAITNALKHKTHSSSEVYKVVNNGHSQSINRNMYPSHAICYLSWQSVSPITGIRYGDSGVDGKCIQDQVNLTGRTVKGGTKRFGYQKKTARFITPRRLLGPFKGWPG